MGSHAADMVSPKVLKARILDVRQEDRGTCYLCSLSLEDYVANLPSKYSEYSVQRGYVTNAYLDALVDTILRKRFIPPIVLVATEQTKDRSGTLLNIREFKVLDGLQRTFRLHAIWKTVRIALDARRKYGRGVYQMSRLQLLRSFSDDLEAAESNIGILLALLDHAKGSHERTLTDLFPQNQQWFEIWTGLSSENEVNMMLMLNAGHKPVALRHQLELLFINLLSQITAHLGSKFNLVRERQKSATRFAKTREVGDFHFAHLLSALLSLSEGTPITPSADLINALQSAEERQRYEELFQETSLKEFLDFIVKLDESISKRYGRIGTTWMGRDVFLTGVLAAVGRYAREEARSPKQSMDRLLSMVLNQRTDLRLEELEQERNQFDLSKVNIGNANKRAIFLAFTRLLQSRTAVSVDWKKIIQET